MSVRAPLPDLYAGMNKTEKARAIELEALKRAGKIAAWWYEALTFKLADDTRYTPDFLVQESDGLLRVEEIKGFLREDAAVKLKVFVKMFPFPLKVFYKAKGSGWDVVEYGGERGAA